MSDSSTTNKEEVNTKEKDDFFSNLSNVNIFMFILLAVVFVFVFSSVLGGGDNENESNPVAGLFVGLLAITIIYILAKYFWNYDFRTEMLGYGTDNPKLNIDIDHLSDKNVIYSSVPNFSSQNVNFNNISLDGKQVFNIPENKFTYEDAKAVCKAYDGDLATYDQIESAYNQGAEWCNYGWSKDQMALFPTQKLTFDKLQKIKGHEHDCGRPGINGGYIANPNVKYGVNCYGKKRPITQYESDLMKTMPAYPQNEQDFKFQDQVNYWKSKIDEILISPFNHSSWNKL
jgi:hypothetical protein